VTPEALARLHAEAFSVPRPWTPAEFAGLLAHPGSFLLHERDGFLLGRAAAGEAELLTLAVAATARRRGMGRRLVLAFLAESARRGAMSAFLEVAATNAAAIALYRATGFAEAGRRRAYYRGPDGDRIDAVVMSLHFPAQRA
jgi:ribosomal-protein-alanine N-acetyltransferase